MRKHRGGIKTLTRFDDVLGERCGRIKRWALHVADFSFDKIAYVRILLVVMICPHRSFFTGNAENTLIAALIEFFNDTSVIVGNDGGSGHNTVFRGDGRCNHARMVAEPKGKESALSMWITFVIYYESTSSNTHMKISIAYPPIPTDKGAPLLSQNRQFQYFNAPTYIYPVVPAYAATFLKSKGYDVRWNDGIAEQQTFSQFVQEIREFGPDLMAVESKTPTIKAMWRAINALKELFPETKIVLMGDHVTALPEESLQNSVVDYVITGGDFDFQLEALARHLDVGDPMSKGTYYRESGEIKNTGVFEARGNLEQLPMIDRTLTKWWLYAYRNGNFKYLPGTYTMVGRDCWWRRPAGKNEDGSLKLGGCTFCSWTSIWPTWRTQSAGKLLDELEYLVSLGIRENFDDTGTLPVGPWLQEFCEGMIKRGLHKKITFGCNMRAGALTREQYQLMGKANFRFILYGLESASQKTLDGINKGTTPKQMEDAARWASEAGCHPHVTCMVGYPWETYEEAKTTVDFTKSLFQRGYIKTLQATVTIPYPGTELFRQCKKNGWLLTEDWDEYDMREPVMKSPISHDQILSLTQGIYKSALTPKFVMKELASIRTWDDVKYYWRAGRQFSGHLFDFQAEKGNAVRAVSTAERTQIPS